jgi:hypothetical protein
MTESMNGLTTRLQGVRQFFEERMRVLSGKQDSLASAQDEMKDQLSHVGDHVSLVHQSVQELESGVAHLQGKQDYAIEGIAALGGMILELLPRGSANRLPAAVKLQKFLHRAPSAHVSGLEGLLSDVDASAPVRAPSENLERLTAIAAQAEQVPNWQRAATTRRTSSGPGGINLNSSRQLSGQMSRKLSSTMLYGGNSTPRESRDSGLATVGMSDLQPASPTLVA